jgi:O-antigen ligase
MFIERQLLIGAAATAADARPISLLPDATAMALAIDAGLALAFWSTQRALRRGGVRWLSRMVATIGLIVAPVSIAHHLGWLPALDATWPVARRDLRSWGPFMNRNDFAGWMLLGSALALGYFVARLEAHHHGDEALDVDRAFDATGTRVGAALCLMSGAIVVSLSRSGLLGVAVALVTFSLLGRRRLAPTRRYALAGAVAIVIVGGVVFANVGALSARLQNATSEGMSGRWSEWSQTWPMVEDFWRAGTGVGAYARVMTLYQTSERLITIAHADNEPLQLAAEGGLLVGLPLVLMVTGFVVAVARRLRSDRSRMFWIRAGAISGLAGIAAQNLVEMTLRVPATGLLVVILAAVAVHDRSA